jgi:hypothetical protein
MHRTVVARSRSRWLAVGFAVVSAACGSATSPSVPRLEVRATLAWGGFAWGSSTIEVWSDGTRVRRGEGAGTPPQGSSRASARPASLAALRAIVDSPAFRALEPRYGVDCRCEGYLGYSISVFRETGTQHVDVAGGLGTGLVLPEPMQRAQEALGSPR